MMDTNMILTDTARNMILELGRARQAKAEADARLGQALRQTARYLVHDLGMTRQQAGRCLGMSHVRVVKLLQDVEWTEAA